MDNTYFIGQDERDLHTIHNPPAFDEIADRVRKLRLKCLAEGLTPTTLMIGTDLYLVIWQHGRHFVHDTSNRPAEDTGMRFYGLEVLCNPFSEPMDLSILPSPQDCALRAEMVRKINE